MAVILETLSLRSLLAFAFLLVGILITFFVVGGKIAPAPTSATSHTANICVANTSQLNSLLDPVTCFRIQDIKEAEKLHIRADHVVFAIRFPHPGLSMSRWFQFVTSSIRLDIDYDRDHKYEKGANLRFDAYLAYRGNKSSGSHEWHLWHEAHEDRPLNCEFTRSQVRMLGLNTRN